MSTQRTTYNNTKRVVIAGGLGLIGTACTRLFREFGFKVIVLSRQAQNRHQQVVQWAPERSWIAQNVVDGAYAVINLTGASLADRRWTRGYKKELIDSRIKPAAYLHTLIRTASSPPSVYIGASGIGIYGNSGAASVDETTVINSSSFLSELVKEWEKAHLQVAGDIRVVILRIGVVLMSDGGFYQKMKLPARLGIYPIFGSGQQVLSWIHINDLIRLMLWSIDQQKISGVFNAVSGNAVTYREFAAAHRSLSRSGLILGIPRFVAQSLLGEMTDMLFESCNASNRKLLSFGFDIRYSTADSALRDISTHHFPKSQ